jgi:hypothetical protein
METKNGHTTGTGGSNRAQRWPSPRQVEFSTETKAIFLLPMLRVPTCPIILSGLPFPPKTATFSLPTSTTAIKLGGTGRDQEFKQATSSSRIHALSTFTASVARHNKRIARPTKPEAYGIAVKLEPQTKGRARCIASLRTDLLGGGEGALSRGLALELSLRHGRGGGWQGKSLRRLLSRGSRRGEFGVFYWPGRKGRTRFRLRLRLRLLLRTVWPWQPRNSPARTRA